MLFKLIMIVTGVMVLQTVYARVVDRVILKRIEND